MLSPGELAAVEAKYADAFADDTAPSRREFWRTPLAPSPAVEAAVDAYRRWRDVVAALATTTDGYAVARGLLRKAHHRLAHHLRHHHVYEAADGVRYTYCEAEDSLLVRPPMVYAKKDREHRAECRLVPDPAELARSEAAHRAWEARRAARPAHAPSTPEDPAMVMVQLEPAEVIYLPAPDGREVKVEAPALGAERSHAVTITIPGLQPGDRVDVAIGGGPLLSIAGAAWKSGATRLALDIPASCKIRHPGRARRPLKARRAPHADAD